MVWPFDRGMSRSGSAPRLHTGGADGGDGDQQLRQTLLASAATSFVNDLPDTAEMRYVRRRIQANPLWTVDRGTGFYAEQRQDRKRPSLLAAGR